MTALVARGQTILCFALCGATLLLAAAVFVTLQSGGAGRIGGVTVLELSGAYDQSAGHELEKARPNLAVAEAWTRRALELAPYDTPAWVQLANIEAVRDGRLGPDGVHNLQVSYDLVGYDPIVADWRIRLALDHWRELPPELQGAVASEFKVVGGVAGYRQRLRVALAKLRDPAGRQVAASWLATS